MSDLVDLLLSDDTLTKEQKLKLLKSSLFKGEAERTQPDIITAIAETALEDATAHTETIAAELPRIHSVMDAATGMILPPDGSLFKIAIDPGKNRQDGFVGISERSGPATDHVVPLRELPWPIETATVDYIECTTFFCTLTAPQRIQFLDECWRVLKPDTELKLLVPARGSNHALMDPTYQWPEIVEDFFYFSNRIWREGSGFGYYDIKCNFDWTYGFIVDQEIQVKNEELQRLAMKFARNAAHMLCVNLKKIADE